MHEALKAPAVARFVRLVEAAQLERVIAGEFGVRAQARAAGPRIMHRVIEKAGGIEDPATGQPIGMAPKDADMLRAADLALTIGGGRSNSTSTRTSTHSSATSRLTNSMT